MSARDNMPDPVLGEIAALLPQIKAARDTLQTARNYLATLRLEFGQSCAAISFAGRLIELTAHDRTYMPKKIAGRQALLDAVTREQQDFVVLCASKVEGLEHRLRQLAQATGSTS
jgi:hypothetical protein